MDFSIRPFYCHTISAKPLLNLRATICRPPLAVRQMPDDFISLQSFCADLELAKSISCVTNCRMKANFLGFPLLVLILFLPSAMAEVRVFTSKDGRTIKASIESVDEESVDVRREDGYYFTIPRTSLSDEDNSFLDRWLIGSKATDERLLRIQARRRDGNDSKSDSMGLMRESKDGWYEVDVENRTGIDLSALEIRYALKVEKTTAGKASDRKSDVWEKGEVDELLLEDGVESSFETKKLRLTETRLKPGWVWTSNAPPTARDKLDGVYVAFLFDGEVVREFAMPSGVLEDGREFLFPKKSLFATE